MKQHDNIIKYGDIPSFLEAWTAGEDESAAGEDESDCWVADCSTAECWSSSYIFLFSFHAPSRGLMEILLKKLKHYLRGLPLHPIITAQVDSHARHPLVNGKYIHIMNLWLNNFLRSNLIGNGREWIGREEKIMGCEI